MKASFIGEPIGETLVVETVLEAWAARFLGCGLGTAVPLNSTIQRKNADKMNPAGVFSEL